MDDFGRACWRFCWRLVLVGAEHWEGGRDLLFLELGILGAASPCVQGLLVVYVICINVLSRSVRSEMGGAGFSWV